MLNHLLSNQRRFGPMTYTGRGQAGGFVLMDVLISILLFCVGVLALIALQTTMTRNQTEAKVRAEASYLASEILGQLWSDASQLDKYTESGCETLERCKEWQDKVSTSLPSGIGTIESDTTTGDVKVSISWTMSNGEAHKYVTQTTVTNQSGI